MEASGSTVQKAGRYVSKFPFREAYRQARLTLQQLLGHFEHLHVGQLSCGIFADSQTLVTSGTDCSISVWSFISAAKFVDLQPKTSLFGHRSPVTILAVSRSFSTILSASTDGHIMLWDLNRLEFVRELPPDGPVEVCSLSHLVTEAPGY